MMNLESFQLVVERTKDRCPHAGTGDVEERAYLALALAGEAGELANSIKKEWRAGARFPDHRDHEIKDELGDILWYWVALCRVMGLSPEEVMAATASKLAARRSEDDKA